MMVDNIDYTQATLKDFLNLPAALNAFRRFATWSIFPKFLDVNFRWKSD